MTIPWNKCSERMPLDDDGYLIAKADLHDGRPFITDGWTMNHSTVEWHEWIPYDEEIWRKVNDLHTSMESAPQ